MYMSYEAAPCALTPRHAVYHFRELPISENYLEYS